MHRTLIFTVVPASILTLLLGVNGVHICAAEGDTDPVLVKVTTKRAKSYAGELVTEDDGDITIIDLVTNRPITIERGDVLQVIQPATLAEVTGTAGLPAVTAWNLRKLASVEHPVGKIARVTPQVVYITLSSANGISVDDSLTVYRNKGEIKDPDTGDVLAIERPKICELQVVEVSEGFSKAKIKSEFEVTLEAGDEVEPSEKSNFHVAVYPVYHQDGNMTNISAKITEDLTTVMAQQGIPVVERSVLKNVLPELGIQQTVLFEPQTVQRLGKLAGASVVVTGKVVREGRIGTVYIRAVDVKTGKILFSASDDVSLVNAEGVASSRAFGLRDAQQDPAARQFVGRWNVRNGDRNLFVITLKSDYTSETTNVTDQAGTWEVVGDEAWIMWRHDWKDRFRPVGGGFVKDAFGPGMSWNDKPKDRLEVKKIP